MSFTPIDLSRLPAPNVVEPLDYESILAERKAALVSAFPEDEQEVIAARLALESDPLNKLLQENAYRELIWRQRVNEAALATMLAFAEREDLEHVAARFNVQRLVIIPANPNAVPPVAAVMEGDDSLRERTQMAMEGLSVAGPRNAYIFHARSADGRVGDAWVESPNPAEILLTIQSALGDGTANAELLGVVDIYVSGEDRRPLADRVTLQSAEVLNFEVTAVLHLDTVGPEQEPIRAAAEARLAAMVNRRRRLGWEVNRSGLDAALHIEGVKRVDLPGWVDIVATGRQAPFCIGYSVTVAE
ncbi:baseplate J/gp47 family protein [Pseudomonas sp. B11D7D]|nr:baseplate J/gp47 family protein [Pseudomonas sp. B11D7D]QNH04443.1 baseplate J/gp47 family protein [Pseudomonas sp. B11D7D]